MSVILNYLGGISLKLIHVSSQSELSDIKTQLQNDFLPDDVCPLGAQFMEAQRQNNSYGPKLNNEDEKVILFDIYFWYMHIFNYHNRIFFSLTQATPDVFSVDEDILIEEFEGTDTNSAHSNETSLLDVNQLLDSVCITP